MSPQDSIHPDLRISDSETSSPTDMTPNSNLLYGHNFFPSSARPAWPTLGYPAADENALKAPPTPNNDRNGPGTNFSISKTRNEPRSAGFVPRPRRNAVSGPSSKPPIVHQVPTTERRREFDEPDKVAADGQLASLEGERKCLELSLKSLKGDVETTTVRIVLARLAVVESEIKAILVRWPPEI